VLFGLAYSDTDPDDGGYNVAIDVLIAKLIDGPGAAGDGSIGPGDVIITYQYPMDFGPSAFGQFTVTEHIVTDVNVGMLAVCNVDTAAGIFVWGGGAGDLDLYQEYDSTLTPRVRVMDGRMVDSDMIAISISSPSQPSDAVATMIRWDSDDASFIDVEADCSG
jgi:hypothetical protein